MIQRTAPAHAAVPSINGLARFFNRLHHGLMAKYVDAGSLLKGRLLPNAQRVVYQAGACEWHPCNSYRASVGNSPPGEIFFYSRACSEVLLSEVAQACVFFNAAPLCIAMWSVLSLLISYCGSSGLA